MIGALFSFLFCSVAVIVLARTRRDLERGRRKSHVAQSRRTVSRVGKYACR